MFMKEFTVFSEQIVTRSESVVLLNELTIHIYDTSGRYLKQFQYCLESSEPNPLAWSNMLKTTTHSGGRILDLVIAKQ